MPIVIILCCVLVITTTVLHYEVLRLLNIWLPVLQIPERAKLVVVILTAFVAHVIEMALYGATLYALVAWVGIGALQGSPKFSLMACMYFSAETYTSLGFGDLTPVGPIRLLAALEALNGLLLIGWSASFTYISMEKFWRDAPRR
ncbi:MAG: ion channel [Pseudomonadota bacterium]